MRTKEELTEFLITQAQRDRVRKEYDRSVYEDLAEQMIMKHILGEDLTYHQHIALDVPIIDRNNIEVGDLFFDEN